MPQGAQAPPNPGLPLVSGYAARLHAPGGVSQADVVRSWPAKKQRRWFRDLSPEEAHALEYAWDFWARPKQLSPRERYLVWLVMAGRGFGKTRIGTQETVHRAETGRVGGGRIALIGRTLDEAEGIMVSGESGILTYAPPWSRPKWVSSKRELRWNNGVIARVFGAHEPDSFRGFQSGFFWADEAASWKYPESFTQLLMGLRLGRAPQGVVTTTPKPKQLLRDLLGRASTILTKGTTYENLANLAETFAEEVLSIFEGTRMGRQELRGELLEDVEGSLWKRAQLEELRVLKAPKLRRVVVGVDPAAMSKVRSNNTGIVGAGIGDDRAYYVLADATVNAKPHVWATAAITLYHALDADAIVAEVNQGGEMVESTIKTIDPTVCVRMVHATRNKRTRAEPVSSLYEQKRVRHVGTFTHLEDEMCGWDPMAEGDSPDRVDGLVWAITDLMAKSKSSRTINMGGSGATARENPYKDVI